MSRLHFTLEAKAPRSRARATTFTTLHGRVQTPIFMPVGTQATVKSQTVESLKTTGSNVLLANTYHLLLRPGPEVLKKFGGIHRFMNWPHPVLTDSGGFQIFSLPHSRQMNEDGARFQSYIDGKMILLSPEVSIQTQRTINSDIMMVLDQCIPSTSPHAEAKAAMELTHRWAVRSLAAREDSPQALFGIVQGACYQDLRKESADFLANLSIISKNNGLDGLAIGGLAVGESKNEREDFTEITTSFLPENLPRYLMGVGTPIDILEAVHRGVDMFDCILPSQLAQRGSAFTSLGKFQLRRGVYKFSEEKLDPECDCSTCTNYSKAYLHHLTKSSEVLGWHLIALHNFSFYHRMMKNIRENILKGTFYEYYQTHREKFARDNVDFPSKPTVKTKPTRFEKLQKLGDYEVHLNKNGPKNGPVEFASIRQISSGEIMHSVTPPEIEARTLYIESSDFKNRIAQKNENGTLVIWDVGLGAASNAMAAIQELSSSSEELKAKISIISFEIDLDPLRLALKHPLHFKHLRHPGPATLLKDKIWTSPTGHITWNLYEGDFLKCMHEAPAPDLIYYDPFSFKTDSPLWTQETFRKIYSHTKSQPAKLITYSASTAVRAALLAENFFVGAGVATGPKSETTIAFTDRDEAMSSNTLLGAEWLARYARSDAKKTEIEGKIKNHPQFCFNSPAGYSSK